MVIERTLEALNQLTQLFERASRFEGRPRERLLALIEAEEIFCRRYPGHYRALQLIRIASQMNGPVVQRDSLARCESRRITYLTGVIAEGVDQGDLILGVGRRAEDLAFTLWALAFGTRAIMNTFVATSQLGIRDGIETVRRFVDDWMDALNWRPLTREWDYARTRRRVREELLEATRSRSA